MSLTVEVGEVLLNGSFQVRQVRLRFAGKLRVVDAIERGLPRQIESLKARDSIWRNDDGRFLRRLSASAVIGNAGIVGRKQVAIGVVACGDKPHFAVTRRQQRSKILGNRLLLRDNHNRRQQNRTRVPF